MRLPAIAAVAIFTVAGATVASSQAVNAQAQISETNGHKVVVVEKGDNLSKIANHYDTTYQRIYDANTQIEHPDLIYPDQKFRIPTSDEKLDHRELPNDPAVQAAAKQSEVQASQRAKARVARTHTAAPVTRTVSAQKSYAPAVASGSVWDRLAQCESGGNWHISTGNGFYGGLQFTVSSWHAVGGSGMPNQASREEQIARGKILQARQGWGAWPACTAKLGIR